MSYSTPLCCRGRRPLPWPPPLLPHRRRSRPDVRPHAIPPWPPVGGAEGRPSRRTSHLRDTR
eukprot:13261660-Alexandrium_andersonii.AAC.1